MEKGRVQMFPPFPPEDRSLQHWLHYVALKVLHRQLRKIARYIFPTSQKCEAVICYNMHWFRLLLILLYSLSLCLYSLKAFKKLRTNDELFHFIFLLPMRCRLTTDTDFQLLCRSVLSTSDVFCLYYLWNTIIKISWNVCHSGLQLCSVLLYETSSPQNAMVW